MYRTVLLPALLGVAALATMAAPAAAKATYSWVPDDRSGCCRGQIEISDEAYFAAQASWRHDQTPVAVPVERFIFEGRFTVLDELKRNPENPTLDVTVNPVLAAEPASERCCEWDIQVRITETGLEGHMRVKTKGDEVAISGDSDQWGVDLAKSDVLPSGIICGAQPKGACANARGRWVLISAPTAPAQ